MNQTRLSTCHCFDLLLVLIEFTGYQFLLSTRKDASSDLLLVLNRFHNLPHDDHRSIGFCLTFFLQHLDSPIVFVIFIIVTTLFPTAGASKGNPPPSFMHDHLHYSYYSYIHASIAGQLSSFPLHGRISNKLGRIKLSEAQSELVQAWSKAWSEAA